MVFITKWLITLVENALPTVGNVVQMVLVVLNVLTPLSLTKPMLKLLFVLLLIAKKENTGSRVKKSVLIVLQDVVHVSTEDLA